MFLIRKGQAVTEPRHVGGEILDRAWRFLEIACIVPQGTRTDLHGRDLAEPAEVLGDRIVIKSVTILDVQQLQAGLAVGIDLATGGTQGCTDATR